MKLAMVFPGQGSQAVGMLQGYAGLPEIDAVRGEAAEVLGGHFLPLLDEGPAEALNQTVNTQPAMVTAGYVAYRMTSVYTAFSLWPEPRVKNDGMLVPGSVRHGIPSPSMSL